jgi:phosphoglycerol transferase
VKHSGIRKFFFCLGVILETLLISLAVLLIFSYRWMMTAWADMSIDELLFQLSQPLQGTGGGMIGKYIINAVVPAVIAAVIFGFVMVRFRKKRVVKIIFAVLPVAAVLSVACTARLAWVTLGADEYFGAEQTVSSSGTGSADFIETHYVDPATAKVTFPEKKRNLIYIFLDFILVYFFVYLLFNEIFVILVLFFFET